MQVKESYIIMKTRDNFEIIDAHAHIFPQKIEEKAVASIGGFYGIPMQNSGLSEKLIKSGSEIGVSRYLVCSTATKAEQVAPINSFIKAECEAHPEFIGFATLHPDYEDIDEAFDTIEKSRFYGIKLHPDFQHFAIDDEKAYEIYKRAEGKLAILFHTGDKRYNFSNPRRLAKVCDKFPNLRVIAAHFGGYSEWDEAYEVYKGKNIFMDTSSSLFELEKGKALAFFDKFGIEQFFFGTDFPMWTHKEELNRLKALDLSNADLKKLLSENFKTAILDYNK